MSAAPEARAMAILAMLEHGRDARGTLLAQRGMQALRPKPPWKGAS
jgi:hypothetical protein